MPGAFGFGQNELAALVSRTNHLRRAVVGLSGPIGTLVVGRWRYEPRTARWLHDTCTDDASAQHKLLGKRATLAGKTQRG
jgi:hypothetical protein